MCILRHARQGWREAAWKTQVEVEDDIEVKRDALIAALEKGQHHTGDIHELFTILWSVGQQGNVSIHRMNIDTFH